MNEFVVLTISSMRTIIHQTLSRGQKMKKILLRIVSLALIASCSLFAQTENANEAYIRAMTAANAAEQAKLLKEYIAKYAGKGTQYENFAYANLALLPYQGKTVNETIEYGEKALALGGLDDLTKCKLLLIVSGIYIELGQNLEKAKNYASQAIGVAEANKSRESEIASAEQWNKLVGTGYFAQGQAMEKAKNYNEAVTPYINSYKILKSPQIVHSLMRVGKLLYKAKSYREAERAFEVAAPALKDFDSYDFYARALHRNGRKEEALQYYRQAHMKQKDGDIAFNIGTLLAAKAERDPSQTQEAISFLLEASFLSEANSRKAMELAESLFFTVNKDLKFNENVQEIQRINNKLQELTNTFNTKFGEKDEEDLTDGEKKEMETLRAQIETEQKALQKLEAAQKMSLDKFNALIEKTKQRLGIK